MIKIFDKELRKVLKKRKNKEKKETEQTKETKETNKTTQMNDLRLQEELFELAQLENVQILPQTESKIKRFITRILITDSNSY